VPGAQALGRPLRKERRRPRGRQIRAEYAETGEPCPGGRGGQPDGAGPGTRARPCRLGRPRPTSLQGLAQPAARPKGSRCRHRDGRRNEACLTQGGRDIRQEAAAGVEHGSAQGEAPYLAAHRHALGERVPQQRSRATRVRRPSMPPGDGTPRPLGIPAVAEQRLPRAVARLLAASAAQDCLRGSSGSRPPVGALEAVETRTIHRPGGRSAWVVETDLTQCGETLAHAWMGRL
jgi:hypothetical protein